MVVSPAETGFSWRWQHSKQASIITIPQAVYGLLQRRPHFGKVRTDPCLRRHALVALRVGEGTLTPLSVTARGGVLPRALPDLLTNANR